jgi:hypothetical protein
VPEGLSRRDCGEGSRYITTCYTSS